MCPVPADSSCRTGPRALLPDQGRPDRGRPERSRAGQEGSTAGLRPWALKEGWGRPRRRGQWTGGRWTVDRHSAPPEAWMPRSHRRAARSVLPASESSSFSWNELTPSFSRLVPPPQHRKPRPRAPWGTSNCPSAGPGSAYQGASNPTHVTTARLSPRMNELLHRHARARGPRKGKGRTRGRRTGQG